MKLSGSGGNLQPVRERFRDHIRDSGLIPGGATVLVGYSGGADSTCLLHLLKEIGVDVAAGHLHHGQREEAEGELLRCESFCAALEIPFVSGRADVPRMARELKIGLEEAGRIARYRFLQNAAFRLQCDVIATAHTRSDLVETVLLNLTRGCGTHGLTGIPMRRDNIVRPLMIFAREETQRYCEENALWFHRDPANEDVSFSRARIRHRVLRELRSINPALDVAVERMVAIVRDEDALLDGMAASGLEQSEVLLNGQLHFLTVDCEAAFDRAKLDAMPAVLRHRGIRLIAEALGGPLDAHQTQAIGIGDRGSVTAGEGAVAIEWDPSTLHLRQLNLAAPFRHPLAVPGETLSDEFGWAIEAFMGNQSDTPARTELTAAVDPNKLKGPLTFRSFQAGDAMNPLGFSGHRKLSTLLSDAKLTRAARARLPIICDMVGPIWAPGVCLDARAAANPGMRNVLILRFGPVKRPEAR